MGSWHCSWGTRCGFRVRRADPGMWDRGGARWTPPGTDYAGKRFDCSDDHAYPDCSENGPRREVLGHAVRGTGLLVLGGAAIHLVRKAGADDVWWIDPEKCKGCMLCNKQCPQDAIDGKVKEPQIIDDEKCIKCGVCRESCKFEAVIVE